MGGAATAVLRRVAPASPIGIVSGVFVPAQGEIRAEAYA